MWASRVVTARKSAMGAGAKMLLRQPQHQHNQLSFVSANFPTTTDWKNSSTSSDHTVVTRQFHSNPRPQQDQNQQQRRHKHSARQANRLFNQHPGRLRVLERERLDRLGLPWSAGSELPLEGSDYYEKTPTYPAVFEPTFLRNSWCAPAYVVEPEKFPGNAPPSTYSFNIKRTKNKVNGAVGFLPVYTDYKHGKSQVTTLIRKLDVDSEGLETFVEELKIHLAKWHKERMEHEGRILKKSALPEIRIRSGHQVEIKGNYATQVRYWLASLGF
jgi:hypothetical protein